MFKMAQGQRKYEKEYKVQAVKLAKEIAGKARRNCGYRWIRCTGGRRRCGRDGWTQAPGAGALSRP